MSMTRTGFGPAGGSAVQRYDIRNRADSRTYRASARRVKTPGSSPDRPQYSVASGVVPDSTQALAARQLCERPHLHDVLAPTGGKLSPQ